MIDVINGSGAGVGIGISAACRTLNLARSTFYRWRKPRMATPSVKVACRFPGRRLSLAEEERVVSELNSDRFIDKAPPQAYAILLDEGTYLCSISTMYRILRKRGEVKDRRGQRTHASAQRPELLATGPNQVWSWDITKLKGPKAWRFYHLYVIIDVFSRFVVGWCIARKSNAKIAEALIQDAIFREGIPAGQLTIHADNGGEMTSITVAELLIDLGIVKSHSRPHTSNDNPFSESHFKTMKYRPEIPARFGSDEEARALFRILFEWYNKEHRHSSLALLTPETVHRGKAAEAIRARAAVLDTAYAAHPDRFVNKPPRPELPPTQVWINPPPRDPEASRDGSEPVGSAKPPCVAGKQELPPDVLEIAVWAGSHARPETSRDASGGCDATTP